MKHTCKMTDANPFLEIEPSENALAAASQILRQWHLITEGEAREYAKRIARIIDHHTGAKIQTYESDKDPFEIPENPTCNLCGDPAGFTRIEPHKRLLRCRKCISPLLQDEWSELAKP